MNRRALLSAVGFGIASATAGCFGGDSVPGGTDDSTNGSDDPTNGSDGDGPGGGNGAGGTDGSGDFPTPDGYERPEGEPPAVPDDLTCEADRFERIGQFSDEDDIAYGATADEDGPRLGLRSDQFAYDYGDTVTVELRNLTDTHEVVESSIRFNLQVYTSDGWQDIRGRTDGNETFFWEDLGDDIEPDEGYDWEFTFTEEGIEEISTPPHAKRLVRVCPELQTGRYRFLFFEQDLATEFDIHRD